MQPPTDGPRAGFTTAQVQYLVENSSSFDVDMGMELLADDLTMSVEEDISDDLFGAPSVQRNSLANMHASLTMSTSRPLNWGRSIVRPYMVFTGPISAVGPIASMRFNLGAYYADTPEGVFDEEPATYDVTGYDILSVLDDPIGDAYSIDAGAVYLDQIEEILTVRGVSQYVIDREAAARVVTSPLVYAMEDNATWLGVVNDLLAAVGYAGIWSDWNGTLRCQAYRTPSERSPEWYFTSDVANTLLTQRRRIQHDFYDAPNRWVFYRSSNTDSGQPVDGAGRWEYVNETIGETSVEARGGRVKTKVVGIDAADQESLMAAGQSVIDADMSIPTTIPIETAPFPLAWHFDRFVVSDPHLGAALQVMATSWSLSLDGSDMKWEWTSL